MHVIYTNMHDIMFVRFRYCVFLFIIYRHEVPPHARYFTESRTRVLF